MIDFKKIIERIPSEYDDYDIVFSEYELIEDDIKLKTDMDISGLISDDENKQMCLLDEKSYKISLDI